jgi:hypothetical protein
MRFHGHFSIRASGYLNRSEIDIDNQRSTDCGIDLLIDIFLGSGHRRQTRREQTQEQRSKVSIYC